MSYAADNVEDELIKVSRFKGEDEGNRQEYLEKLRVHVDNISNDKWKSLSDEAKDWLEAAAEAIEAGNEIPDFEDLGEEDEPADDQASEDDEEPEGEEPPEDDADEPEAEVDEGGPEDEESSDSEGDDQGGEVADEAEPPAEDPEPAPTPKKQAKAKAPAKTPPKRTPPRPRRAPRDYTSLTGNKDRFGVVIGTKTHEAVMMYEKGCTAQDLDEKIGGRHYNILSRLMKDGHKVEKLKDGLWKLTHRDDVVKKPKKGK